jgi:hypothetical protein
MASESALVVNRVAPTKPADASPWSRASRVAVTTRCSHRASRSAHRASRSQPTTPVARLRRRRATATTRRTDDFTPTGSRGDPARLYDGTAWLSTAAPSVAGSVACLVRSCAVPTKTSECRALLDSTLSADSALSASDCAFSHPDTLLDAPSQPGNEGGDQNRAEGHGRHPNQASIRFGAQERRTRQGSDR